MCVIVGYMLPLVFMQAGVALLLWQTDRVSVPRTALSAICAFLTSGASLNVAVLNCGLFLLAGRNGLSRDKRRWVMLVPFVAALLGALLNLASPGNYIRHDALNSDYAVPEFLLVSARLVAVRLAFFVRKTPVLVVMLVLFVLFYRHAGEGQDEERMKAWHPLLSGILIFAGITAIDFPVCLGYQSYGLSDRTRFVQDLGIFWCMLFWLYDLAFWAKRRFRPIQFTRRKQTVAAGLSLLWIVILFVLRGYAGQMTTLYMWRTILDGSAKAYADYQMDLLTEIESSTDADVVLERKPPVTENALILDTGMTDDPEWWINHAIAQYYGKESVRLILR